ncbi:MAG TPA: divalent-cation tolerance protein CutA [Streptomyces sp.]|jgi:periplasmic divalent cation tolerance protein|nr:divalent-cation tolerance protein CutA [Streptomyces sp.]
MTDLVHVYTATPDRESAVELAKGVTAQRLAAGAQVVGPVVSLFWHLGEFGEGEEWQLILKTTVDRYPDLEAHLLAEHPWDNPEVAAVPVVEAAQRFKTWVVATVSDPAD